MLDHVHTHQTQSFFPRQLNQVLLQSRFTTPNHGKVKVLRSASTALNAASALSSPEPQLPQRPQRPQRWESLANFRSISPSVICRRVKPNEFPIKNLVSKYTRTNKTRQFAEVCKLKDNWNLVKTWDEESRYSEAFGEPEAREMLEAVTDPI